MAPSRVLALLAPRQTLSSGSGTTTTTSDNNNTEYCDIYGCYSTWDNWGRWVALVVVILSVLIIAFAFSCLNSRRRRRRGMAPMYGTGWMAGKYPPGPQYYNGYGQNQYYGHQTPYGQPAPPYSPQVENQTTGNTFNSNEGYYGHHGGDYELQQPQSAYQPQRGGDPVYDAPQGPPKKGGGIIR